MQMLMRLFFFLSLILVIPFALEGNNESSQAIFVAMDNWSRLQKNGDYEKAANMARKAFELSKVEDNKALMALALNREGQSLAKMPKRVKKHRKLAKEAFEKSLFLLASSNNHDLRIDNLKRLKSLSEINNDLAAAKTYQKQITHIQNLIAEKAKNESLVSSNVVLAENNEILAEQLDSMNVVQDRLSTQVKSLTEAQLKAQLLIALQKNEVDSLLYAHERDSLILAQRDLVLSEQKAQLELQDSELELKSSQRNFFLALAGIVFALGLGTFLRFMETRKLNRKLAEQNQVIEKEQKRSDELLLNILPAAVATELKMYGSAAAKKYDAATVLFADFKNFSSISEKLSPEELISELDFHFKTFDQIIGKYQLEKIKTIGDSYMVAGGLPEPSDSHPEDMIKAALEMQSYLNAWKMEKEEKGEPVFEARIGIHTGPLIAGVVGERKFAYDVWGDTVNVAARLESKSDPGRVNISASTYELVKEGFDCEYRGKIPVKNKGEVEMYYVNGMVAR